LLAQGQWFSPGTPTTSTTKTGCHDIAEILLKAALNTKKSNPLNYMAFQYFDYERTFIKIVRCIKEFLTFF
jgi:hypothetical protein